jgi:GntR family transcriptional repressor for pyruvate dehydrogenase complex
LTKAFDFGKIHLVNWSDQFVNEKNLLYFAVDVKRKMGNRLQGGPGEGFIPVRPVRKKSVPEEIILELKSLIDSGHLSPGSKLPGERELAQMMNVSRPSLREALRVLSLLGVIENRPGSGTYLASSSERWPVEPFSILFLLKKSTLLEIFEARKLLEGGVAALAAEHRSEEDLLAMEETLKNMRLNLRHSEKYAKYELEFHRAIIEAAGNLVIADLMEKLYKLFKDTKSRVYRQYGLSNKSYRSQDCQNHELILNAIRARDAQMATKTMVNHLLEFQRKLKDGEEKEDRY